MISNWDFSLVLAISELLVDPQQPSSLLDIKLHAFQKAKDLTLQYEKRGIRRDLLDVILDSQPISGCQRSLQRRAQACNAPVLLSSLTNRCAPSPTPGVYRTSLLRGSGQ